MTRWPVEITQEKFERGFLAVRVFFFLAVTLLVVHDAVREPVQVSCLYHTVESYAPSNISVHIHRFIIWHSNGTEDVFEVDSRQKTITYVMECPKEPVPDKVGCEYCLEGFAGNHIHREFKAVPANLSALAYSGHKAVNSTMFVIREHGKK